MKNDHPVITLLGSNSGKNLGDAAIMASILNSLSKEIPNAEFLVPTTNPPFVNDNYGKRYNVKAVDIMPWTLSLRFLGLTTLLALKRSDVALICDGIIFGKKLFNPAFNFLITLVVMVPLARLLGCRTVCYSCGIGPFPGAISRLFAKWTLNSCDLVIMREHDSRRLAEEIGVTKSIEVTGDAAFINEVSSDDRAREIMRERGISEDKPIFGVNVTSYFDAWLSSSERLADRSSFIDMLAAGINSAKQRLGEPFQVVVFSTHPMDEKPAYELAEKTGGKVVANSSYLSHDIMSVMRRAELFIGMRFHSVVLASAVESPILALIYAPKVRGYMRLLGCEEYALELKELTSDRLSERIQNAWPNRQAIKLRQKGIVDELKRGAERAARTVRDRYFPELSQARSVGDELPQRAPTEAFGR